MKSFTCTHIHCHFITVDSQLSSPWQRFFSKDAVYESLVHGIRLT